MSNNKKRKLTRVEQKHLNQALERARNKPKGVKSAQDSIPFDRMFTDGICRVTDTLYTKTLQFSDINYQIAQNEDKTAIFDGWCDFLNYFDSSIKFQLSFVNSTASIREYENSIFI
ncbi:MAG: conjugal transfer protein TraE, partial [Eubacteriales bacterium]